MVNFPTWKKALVAIVCLIGLMFALPNFISDKVTQQFPDFIPSQSVNLGLDLRGGSHLLLEVEVQAVIDEQLDAAVDAARAALRGERIRYTGLGKQTRSISVNIPDEKDREKALALLRDIDTDSEATLEGEKITLEMTEAQVLERKTSAVQQSIEIIRRRIDETGVREPTIQQQGQNRIILQMPGVEDPQRVKDLIGKTANLSFQMVDVDNPLQEALAGRVPPGSEVLQMAPNARGPGQPDFMLVRKRVDVSGQNLVDSQPSFDGRTNQPVVTFRFDTAGARRFGEVSTNNVGRPFAIVLDDEIISAPVIQEPILGGTGQISGRFSVQETSDLALLLRAGALPAPISAFLEERTVGPGYGRGLAVAAGQFASVVGLVAVLIFHGRRRTGDFGLYADIALWIANVILISRRAVGVLQATLTLPGIAGYRPDHRHGGGCERADF